MVDTTKICRQLEHYVNIYYIELRSQIARYSSIQDIFPSFLRGSKRIVAELCADGVLLSHWASKEDSFVCKVKQMSVSEAILEISGGVFAYEYPPDSTFDLQVAGVRIQKGTVETGSLIWRSPWDRIEASSKLGFSRWGDTPARMSAVNDVLTFVAANLMQMKDAQPSDILNRLRVIIEEFEDLLEEDLSEEDLQKFLSTHPVLLSPTALEILPKHRLGKEYITDFVICEVGSEYILVEIEAPSQRLFNKSGDPSAPLTHTQRQVEDWREWVSENIAYARKSLSGINDPDCWIIMGRDISLSSRDCKALDRKNKELLHITIMTFDDLFKKACRHFDNLNQLQ